MAPSHLVELDWHHSSGVFANHMDPATLGSLHPPNILPSPPSSLTHTVMHSLLQVPGILIYSLRVEAAMNMPDSASVFFCGLEP